MHNLLEVAIALPFLAILTWFAYAVITRLFAGDESSSFIRRVFLAAVLIRAIVALVSYLALPYGYLAPDEVGYVNSGHDVLATGEPGIRRALSGTGWLYFNALLAYPFGVHPVIPRFWNCVVGGAGPVIGFALARRLGAGSAARVTAILLAVFPSVVLWSSLNLKDADVFFLILLGLLFALRLQERRGASDIAGLCITFVVLLSLRQFASLNLAVSVAVAWIAASGVARRIGSVRSPWLSVGVPIIACLAIFLVVASVVPSFGETVFRLGGLEPLARLRQAFAVGAGSATNAAPGLETLPGVLVFLPQGLADFFLRPFPWERGSSLSLLTRPETVAYYLLLATGSAGMVVSLRRQASRSLPLVSFFVLSAVGYSLVLSNLGTIYRERAQLLLILFVFVGVACERLTAPARLPPAYPGVSK